MKKYKIFGKVKSLEELAKENNVKVPKKRVDEPIIFTFEHFYNPWHFYCRLIELGISKKESTEYAKKYEVEIYKPVMKSLKTNLN